VNARPDFLIIGAQKAGTSSLYAWLTEHRDVLPAARKEVRFFSRSPETKSIAQYWAYFPLRAHIWLLRRSRGRPVVTGEATPRYLFDPCVPELVKRYLPDVKIIVVLRDPVDRAISHYWMRFNAGKEPLSLEDAIAAEAGCLERGCKLSAAVEPKRLAVSRSYVARGQYADQLERWFEHFPGDQFCIIDFADLVADPAAVVASTLEFLGVESDASMPQSFEAKKVGRKNATDPTTRRLLEAHFESSNRRLRQMVGLSFSPKEPS
jgi:predicted ester cyclase